MLCDVSFASSFTVGCVGASFFVFIWSFGLTLSFLPPSLLSFFSCPLYLIVLFLVLTTIIYLCLFQISPVYFTHPGNLILLVGAVDRTCKFLLSRLRCTWQKFLSNVRCNMSLHEWTLEKNDQTHINMIIKLALYLVVREDWWLHLCGGTHGEKLLCTLLNITWVCPCITMTLCLLPLFLSVFTWDQSGLLPLWVNALNERYLLEWDVDL